MPEIERSNYKLKKALLTKEFWNLSTFIFAGHLLSLPKKMGKKIKRKWNFMRTLSSLLYIFYHCFYLHGMYFVVRHLTRTELAEDKSHAPIYEPSTDRNSSFHLPGFPLLHAIFSYLRFYTIHQIENASIIRGCSKVQVLFQEVCKIKRINFPVGWWLMNTRMPLALSSFCHNATAAGWARSTRRTWCHLKFKGLCSVACHRSFSSGF